ncbi:hypothetical protein DPMN_113283 [Dreissena polymorpha]|uniref:Uncharacterized protein n=1 Tax=Dreissena polymorpha TaxID=45954 RepID=A0A9D4KIS7_DREPO|nr:hypothetical protein DPMN_113283 [Dreissena polymorpha]
MELLFHNLLSSEIASVAMSILIRTSAVLVPSLERSAPKNYKLAPSFGFSPFMVMFARV